ncbi:hypothetical protein KP509_19G032800 [Ceratopteris richardii]|uniref:Uncharacterized protein n=1 Tax=Ceratopteris richardii TaxID=49495 RepID=A0A8T2SKZ9_CERRI|nr:hypothetical protein KP509_19G032800 [Ceratopteris richardii]KAH7352162.1 hypothetical protein KP509_19G032800 [Ceratopteris richardii]
MGRAATQPKFVPVNLNNSYGEGVSPSPSSPLSMTSSSSTSSFGSALHRTRPHGGMVLLTRPSKSSFSTEKMPSSSVASLPSFHKENAKSVWTRPQTSTKPDLGPNSSHLRDESTFVNQLSDGGRTPLMPCARKTNNPTRSLCETAGNFQLPKQADKTSLLREEDFPSLHALSSSRTQHGFTLQYQHGKPLRHVQEKNVLQLSQLGKLSTDNSFLFQHHVQFCRQPLRPIQTALPTNETSTCIAHYKSGDSAVNYRSGTTISASDDGWADDEREVLTSRCSHDDPHQQDQGAWRRTSDLKDQTSRWDIELELSISNKKSIQTADCLLPLRACQDKGVLTDINVSKNVHHQRNILDNNLTESDDWRLDKTRRLSGHGLDSLVSVSRDEYLRGLERNSFLQRALEPSFSMSFPSNIKTEFGTESIFEFKLKAKRRKDRGLEEVQFRDLARESFEAELEKVQEMLELERFTTVDRHSAANLIATQDEKEDHSGEKGSQLQLEVVADDAVEGKTQSGLEQDGGLSSEVKSNEEAPKDERPKNAREEERSRQLLKEVRRKERATKKLLELEELIAKREAEKHLMNTTMQSSVNDHENKKIHIETCVIRIAPTEEKSELHDGSNGNDELSAFSSREEDSREYNEIVSIKAGEEELTSLETAVPSHNLVDNSNVSESLPVANPPFEMQEIDGSHDNYTTPSERNFHHTEFFFSDNTEHGAYTEVNFVHNGDKGFEQSLIVGSKPNSRKLNSQREDCIEQVKVNQFGRDTQYEAASKCLVSEVSSSMNYNQGSVNQKENEMLEGSLAETGLEPSAMQELQMASEQTVLDTSKEVNAISFNPSWHENGEELLLHQVTAKPSFTCDRIDDITARQSCCQGLQQSFTMIKSSQIEYRSHLNSIDEHRRDHQVVSLDMYAAAPFMLNAIQVGSIQIALTTNAESQMLQSGHFHGHESTSLQFGELCSTSLDQHLTTACSTLPAPCKVEQMTGDSKVYAEECTSSLPNTDPGPKFVQVPSIKHSSLFSWIDQIQKQADLTKDSYIQFGDLSMVIFHDYSSPYSSHANLKPIQNSASADSSVCLDIGNSSGEVGRSLNSFKKLVACGQQPYHTPLVIDYDGEHTLAPKLRVKQCDQSSHVIDGTDKHQLKRCEVLPALSGRKGRSNASSFMGVHKIKYWRNPMLRTRDSKVSQLISERSMSRLEGPGRPSYPVTGRFIYKRKDLPSGQNTHQESIEPVGVLPPNASTIGRDQDAKEMGAQNSSTINRRLIYKRKDLADAVKIHQTVQDPADVLSAGDILVSPHQILKAAGACHLSSTFTACKDLDSTEKLQLKDADNKKSQLVISDGSLMHHDEKDDPNTVDDFVKVKSRKQALRKQRKKGDETGSGSGPLENTTYRQSSSRLVQLKRDQQRSYNKHI